MVGVRGQVTDKTSIGNSSPSLVIGDVVIVGPAHDVGMRPPAKTNLKGDVRGFDVHSGKLLWTFHTIPAKGEKGYETWLDGSAETASNAGVWRRCRPTPSSGTCTCPSKRRLQIPTADIVPATIFTATASFASTRRAARSSGISR
jgi:quinoprotein glucose dehydrogenase